MADVRRSARTPDLPAHAAGSRPVAAIITVLQPEVDSGHVVQVHDALVLIGRDRHCDLRLSSSQVSHRHASIRPRDGGIELSDLGSLNGTWLNGDRLTSPAWIGHGDRIRIADAELAVALPRSWSPQPLPPPRDPSATPERTAPAGPPAGSAPAGSLAQQVATSNGFSAGALGLAILGSIVGMVLTTKIELGPWGGLAGAVLGPLLSATFTTRKAGERGRVRLGAICALSALALVITIVGFAAAPDKVTKPLIGDDNPGAVIFRTLSENGSTSGGDPGGGEPTETENLRLNDAVPSEGSVALIWDPPATDDLVTYTVWRNSEPVTSPPPESATYVDVPPSSSEGEQFTYQVVATFADEPEWQSDQLCVTVAGISEAGQPVFNEC